MSVKEFRKKGYLQELNRTYLHPLGLALSVQLDSNGNETFADIWDYQDDEEGVYYDLKNSSPDRIAKFRMNARYVSNRLKQVSTTRLSKLKFIIENIPEFLKK